MKTSRRVAAVLWIGLVLSLFCASSSATCTANGYGCCADGTSGTPCCGYGPCNFLCGNCDGGCRRAPDPIPPGWNPIGCNGAGTLDIGKAINGGDQQSAKPSIQPVAARVLFDSIDTDHDGTISLAEAQAWATKTKSKLSKEELRAEFKKVDTNHDGKIQPAEFDRSLADTPDKTPAEH